MPFSNPVVGGIFLIRPAIRSPNYVPGSAGWTANRDGSAEFGNAVIRGAVRVVGSDGSEVDILAAGSPDVAQIQLKPAPAFPLSFDPATILTVGAGLAPSLVLFGPSVIGQPTTVAQINITSGAGLPSSISLNADQVELGSATNWEIDGADMLAAGRSIPRGYVDGVNVTTGNLTSGTSTVETNISQLQLTANVLQGRTYIIRVQLRLTLSVATDSFDLRLRRDTAVTGTQLAAAQINTTLVSTPSYWWIYESPTTEQLSLFFSVIRTAGTGTIATFGSPNGVVARTAATIEDVGANADFRTA